MLNSPFFYQQHAPLPLKLAMFGIFDFSV